MCGTTDNLSFHQHHVDSLSSCRCSGRISCRPTADDDEAFVDVHEPEDIGATVVVVELVVVEVVVVDVVDAKSGRVVLGTATLFGQ